MTLALCASFVTSTQSHEHARIAEELGYQRVWFYDSPPLTADVWVQLCRAAERTERVGLGPGVLVPSLRHPLTTASAVATLVSIAGPGRVALGVGTGFTGRLMMGQPPLPWRDVVTYSAAVRALLAGERVEWEGRLVQMCHWPGVVPDRPVEVPLVLAVSGPRGIGIAHDLAAGVMSPTVPVGGFAWSTILIAGTVLRDGEHAGGERVMAAAGHAAAIMYHWGLEFGVPDVLPGAKEYNDSWDGVSADERHLLLHEGHLTGLSEHDKPFVTGDLLAATGAAASPAAWRERLAGLEAAGATDVTYQPAGDDIPGELEAFAEMARG